VVKPAREDAGAPADFHRFSVSSIEDMDDSPENSFQLPIETAQLKTEN
jgi:hypothetical protein